MYCTYVQFYHETTRHFVLSRDTRGQIDQCWNLVKRKIESVHNKVLKSKCNKEANSRLKALEDKFDTLENKNNKNLEVII